MNDRDIRQKVYARYAKRQRRVLFFIGLLVTFVLWIFSNFLWAGVTFFASAVGISLGVLAICFIPTFRRFRRERRLFGQGILTEAEVTDIHDEVDGDGDRKKVVEYRFTSSDNGVRTVRRSYYNLDLMPGLLRVGSRVPVFIDRDNPGHYHIELYLLKQAYWREEKRRRAEQKTRKRWRPKAKSVLTFFILALVAAFSWYVKVSLFHELLSNRLGLSEEERSKGMPFVVAESVDLLCYYPGTNEWKYDYGGSVSDITTDNWSFDAECRRPTRKEWGTKTLTQWHAQVTLLIPEKYRERMDEYIYNMEKELKPKLLEQLEGFAPRTGICILSPMLLDTMQIRGYQSWPMLDMTELCAAAAAKIHAQALGVNPDTLTLNGDKFDNLCRWTIENETNPDEGYSRELEEFAGGVRHFDSLFASVGIRGKELVSMRDTVANRATPVAIAGLLERMRKYYSYGQFNRYNSSHREMQDYLEDLLRKYRPSSDFFLSHAQVGDRCVLNVFARSGEWIVIFMEGTGTPVKVMVEKAAELLATIAENMP